MASSFCAVQVLEGGGNGGIAHPALLKDHVTSPAGTQPPIVAPPPPPLPRLPLTPTQQTLIRVRPL